MIKVQHKYLVAILFLLLFVKGFTQEGEHPFTLKTTFHHGAILPHRQEVNEIVEGHTQAYELSFSKTMFGEKSWQQLYNYPQLGVSALTINLGNPKELGMGYGVFPFIELPLTKQKSNKFQAAFKIGYGLGYIQKPFDAVTNFKNVAIGSHFNALIFANILTGVKLSNKINTTMGLSLIHFSNGSFSRPNLGINVFSLNAGLNYRFGKKGTYLNNQIEERPHKWSKSIMFDVGIKEIPPVNGPSYFVSSYSFNLIKTRAQKSSYGFGTDVFYNTSLSELIAQDTNATVSGLDNFRLGAAGIYSFDFGKISVMVELGVYLFSNYKVNGVIYNRLETRYHVDDKIFLRLSMKTHIAVADFIAVGVGYTFK